MLIKLDLPCEVWKKGLVKIRPCRVGVQCRKPCRVGKEVCLEYCRVRFPCRG